MLRREVPVLAKLAATAVAGEQERGRPRGLPEKSQPLALVRSDDGDLEHALAVGDADVPERREAGTRSCHGSIGDVVGRSGRDALTAALPGLRERLRTELVIVNAENASHGFGVAPDMAQAILRAGADVSVTVPVTAPRIAPTMTTA